MQLHTSTASLERAIADLLALMAADSTSGREEPAVAVAADIAAALGLIAVRLPAAPGRDNLLVTPPGVATPRVVLCTHLDTVPPFIPPSRTDDAVHGRGACDAKGVAVAMLHALAAATARLPSAPEAACLLVVGEETDHIGARAFAAAPPFAPEHIVLGEPCGVHPASGQKGLLRLRVETTGRAAHSGWPELGTSAIHKLVPALGRMLNCTLPATAQLGTSTLNIGTLQGGVAANVLAPSASALVLVRCAAPTDSILLALREAAGPDVALHIENRVEPRTFDPIATPELSLLPGPPVPFNTDANDLAVLGTSLHLLGPGDMRCAHGPDERLATAELAEGIEAYTRIILALGSPHTP